MRLNKYIAQATGLSRRAADNAIAEDRVRINNKSVTLGQQVDTHDHVTIDGQTVMPTVKHQTIMLNKPVGYVCSRDGQGNKTIYELLPASLHSLKPVGRLDKNSSGLLLMTTDGQLAYTLTHPRFKKTKTYKIALDHGLLKEDFLAITQSGIMLEDGVSQLDLTPINTQRKEWKVQMIEGRNRQIRRTFEALGYQVVKLHRTRFGSHALGTLAPGSHRTIQAE